MTHDIPSALQVQAWLKPLAAAQLQKLALLSGVPLTTLWNIRSGSTKNPGIETVRKITPYISAAKVAA